MQSKILNWIILLLIIFIVFSYHPLFFTNTGETVGRSNNSIIVLTVFALLLVIPSVKKILRNRFIDFYLICLFFLSLFVNIFYSLGLNADVAEIRLISIPLILMIIGFLSNLEEKNIKIIGLCYTLFLIYVAYLQISQNVGGFIIEDTYKTSAKNSLGAMLTVAGTITMFYLFVNDKMNFLCKAFMLLCCFLIFVELLTIRARLSTLIYLFIFFLLFYKYLLVQNKKKVFFVFLGLIILSCIVLYFLSDYLYNSFFQNKGSDILSGRNVGYEMAIELFLNSPLWGNLYEDIGIAWVHNYLLLTLSSFGLLGGAPWLILYVGLVYKCVKKIITTSLYNLSIGYVLMLVPIITSLGEPTFPYGPGTANFLPFLFLGWSMSVKE